MPASEDRAGTVCIWVVSCFFFVCLTVGGALLVLYVALPETESASWFPIAGMALVGTPWLFWIMTCVYHSISVRSAGAPDRPLPIRTSAVAPSSGTPTTNSFAYGGDDSSPDSPKATRRVKFGVATVMGNQKGAEGVAGTHTKEQEMDGGPHATTALTDDGSSLTSHESERPLARSLS